MLSSRFPTAFLQIEFAQAASTYGRQTLAKNDVAAIKSEIARGVDGAK